MAILTPAEIRSAIPALADDQEFSDSTLAALVAEFTEIAQNYRGVAYQPTTSTETFTPMTYGATTMELSRAKITGLTSVVIDGTTADASTYNVLEWGELGRSLSFRSSAIGYVGASVVVTYTHGYVTPPTTLLRACKQYVRAVALTDRSNVSRDVIAQSFEGMTTRYSTPDWNAGRPTGYLEVDRLLNSLPDYRMPGIA